MFKFLKNDVQLAHKITYFKHFLATETGIQRMRIFR